MEMIGPDTGWVLSDERLTLTDDGGKLWRDVTPQGIAIDRIRGVLFLNGSTGWIGAVTPVPGDPPAGTMVVLRTADGGKAWASASVVGPRMIWPGPPIVTQMYVDFVDAEHGWLAANYRTGMMGQGLLYETDDGGATWTQLAQLPGGSGAVRFADLNAGWWTDGSTGRSYVSHDGGKSWAPESLPPPGCDSISAYSRGGAPIFDESGNGALPASVTGPCASPSTTAFYTTTDGGRSWNFAAMAPKPGPLAVASPDTWLIGTASGIYTTNDAGKSWQRTDFDWTKLDPLANTGDSSYVAPQEMSFIDGETGWAILRSEHFAGMMPIGKYRDVWMATVLIATKDGGRTWTRVQL